MKTLDPLPRCKKHDVDMDMETRLTPEQRWCGTWYTCPRHGCHDAVLLPSAELINTISTRI